MESSEQLAYWRRTRFVAWFTMATVLLFVIGVNAGLAGLNSMSFLGFPLGYFLAVQGALTLFVILVFVYANYQRYLDRKYELLEDD